MEDIIEASQEKEPETQNCKCGQPSDFGCHGVRDMEVFSDFFCKECYNKE